MIQRCSQAVIVFFLLAFTCVSASAQNAARMPGEGPSVEEQVSSEPEPTQQQGETPPFPVVILETPDQRDHATEREAKSDRHEADDLTTQQRAADAADRAATAADRQIVPAWAQAIFAFVSTVLLIATVIYTARTYHHTVRTNRAELRAYVGINSLPEPEIDAHGMWIKVKVEYKNVGQTPAKEVQVATNIYLEPMPFKEEWLAINHAPPEGSRGVLMPGTSAWVSGQLREDDPDVERQITPNDVHAALQDEPAVGLWVFGKVTYSDIFGATHWTTFRYLMKKRKGLSPVFSACADGNDTDD